MLLNNKSATGFKTSRAVLNYHCPRHYDCGWMGKFFYFVETMKKDQYFYSIGVWLFLKI